MKKIKQWFIGLAFAIYGAMICGLGVGVVASFINMVNSTGKEFIGYFIWFVVGLALFLILPYVLFKQLEDSINIDNLKE